MHDRQFSVIISCIQFEALQSLPASAALPWSPEGQPDLLAIQTNLGDGNQPKGRHSAPQ